MKIIPIAFILSLFIGAACNSTQKDKATQQVVKNGDWQSLFDGKSLEGWHIYNKGAIASKWTASNNELVCDPKKKEGIFGDIVTDSTFENFELTLEWKIAKGGNSGIFINVQEDPSYAAAFATGLEMQLLDNANGEHRHQIDTTHWAGCLYGVDCISKNSAPYPYGQWNKSRIVQKDGKVSFWLNDKLTFEAETQSTPFRDKVTASPMKAYPDFGKHTSGKIALQNHTDSVAFRNIQIKKL